MRITDPNHASVEVSPIDRLVDGELGDADRAALLRELDREPDGWKRCAHAFLEAQAWGQAFADDARVLPLGAVPPRKWRLERHKHSAIAAVVVVAFLTGFVSRGPGDDSGNRPDAIRSLAQQTETPAAPRNTVAAASSAVPEYLRRRIERQGYEVDGNLTIVPVALDDGRKVALPVETVSLRYVGQKIH